MKTVGTKYNYWLSGYYDDFNSCRLVADDLNPASYRDLDHTLSHHGSSIGNVSFIPRFYYSYADRLRQEYLGSLHTTYSTEQELYLTSFQSLAGDNLKTNAGFHEALTLNPREAESNLYQNRMHLEVPNSIIANRQKYNGEATDHNYLAFRNGHETAGIYYVPMGIMDMSYGSAPVSMYDITAGVTSQASPSAGNPIPFFHKGLTNTSGSHDTPDKTLVMASFAGAYYHSAFARQTPTVSYSLSQSHEITSPSGQNFFVHNVFIEPEQTASSGTHRVINYTGKLRFKGIGETFNLRLMCDPHSNHTPKYTLKLGYPNPYVKANNTWSSVTSLVTVDIDLAHASLQKAKGSITKDSFGTPANLNQTKVGDWVDVQVVMDFAGNTWKAYADGNTTPFNNGSFGTTFSAATMGGLNGWSLDLHYTKGSDDYINHTTLIDRAGMAIPLTNKFNGDLNSLPPVNKMTMNLGANSTSTCSIDILDDNSAFTLTPLTSTAEDWRLLVFQENEDRPLWWGFIENITHKQSVYDNSMTTTISASDSLSVFNRLLPIWEVGQGAFQSLNNHLSMSASTAKKYDETFALHQKMDFGSVDLQMLDSNIGFGVFNTRGRLLNYNNVANSKMSLYSGTAIQMYINEDEDGANSVEKEWAGLNAANWGMFDIYSMYREANKLFVIIERDTRFTIDTSGTTHYRALAVGDRVSLKGTLTNDADNLIISAITYKQHQGGTDNRYVAFELAVTGTQASDNLQITFNIVNHIQSYNMNMFGNELLEFIVNTPSPHNLSIGDEFVGFSGADHPFAGEVFTVIGVPSAGTVYAETTKKTGLANFTASAATEELHVYRQRDINSHNDKRRVITPAVIHQTPSGATTDTANAEMVRVGLDPVIHSRIHARWMRDLPLSTWFKAQFGIIDAEPYTRAGVGSITEHPFTSTQATANGWATSTGRTSAKLTADIAAGAISITIKDPAIWYHATMNKLDEFILDLIDNSTGEHDFAIGSLLSIQNEVPIDWEGDGTWDFGSAHGLAEGDIIAICGFKSNSALNGVHMVKEISTSTGSSLSANHIKTWKINKYVPTRNSFAFLQAKYQQGSGWNDGTARHNQDPDAVNWSLEATDVNTNFGWDGSFPSAETGGKAAHGIVTIGGVKGVKREWKINDTILGLRKVDESNGYKHIFLSWADMRNDGNADADGGHRKTTYGLNLPTTQNYELLLTFADQFDNEGQPDVFTDLKIGADADIWDIDSTVEPYSGGAWSALDGASNDEPYDTRYHNWQNKGGAIALVDVSRFWNLNTMACGGRPGYSAGGLVDFGDYNVATFGFPYLIDSYWKEATASYKNSGSPIQKHKNSLNFINDGTKLKSNLVVGDTTLALKDITEFDTSGYGVIMCEKGSNNTAEKTAYYYAWTGKGTATINGTVVDTLTGVYLTSYSVVTHPQHAIDQLKADVTAGATGSSVAIGSNEDLLSDDKLDTNFDKVTVYNTTAALYGLRLNLNIVGKITSANCGTFTADEKISFIQNNAIHESWLNNSSLPAISDINNVPILRDNSSDTFGCSIDAKTKTIYDILDSMSSKEGVGIAGNTKRLTFQMGRDNRLEFREIYDLGVTLNRDNLKTSNLRTEGFSQITNVRVYYNGNSSFVDFPTPSENTDIRWKTLAFPEVMNRGEAEALAKQEFDRETESKISIEAEMLRDANNNHKMLSGRRGYIADVFRKRLNTSSTSISHTQPETCWWSNKNGGSPFFGIQNGLHKIGKSKATHTFDKTNPHTSTSQVAHPVVGNEAHPETFGVEGLSLFKTDGGVFNPSGSNTFANPPLTAFGIAGQVIITTASTTFRFDYNGNTGTNVTYSTAGYYNLPCQIGSTGNYYNFRIYYDGTSFSSGVHTINFSFAEQHLKNEAYYFYGANSLSNALQVVHVSAGTNKVSATTGEKLRLAIGLFSGTNSTDVKFQLYLMDCDFNTTATSSNFPPDNTVTNTLNSTYRKDITIDGNGYYTMDIPSSYDGNARKIIFSVNYDYLCALIKERCGDVVAFGQSSMANGKIGLGSLGLSTSADSIFPLGMREYPEMGALAKEHAAYYAPRINIVDDFAYIPATSLTYTDANIDISNERMIIKRIGWQQTERNVEQVKLGLEKLSTHSRYNFARAFKERTGGGGGGGDKAKAKPARPRPPSLRPPPAKFGGSGDNDGRKVMMSRHVDGGDPSSQGMGYAGMTSNDISQSLLNRIKGKSDFNNDIGSSGGTWGILGMKKTGNQSSFDRAVDGVDVISSPTTGVAIATSEGFCMSGIENPLDSGSGQNEQHTYSMSLRVPNDSAGGLFSLESIVSTDTSTNIELTMTATCIETNKSVSTTKVLTGSKNREKILLMPTTLIEGLSTAGNTLKIDITRKPNQGNDNAPYDSLIIHNTSVNLRRLNKPNVAESDNFRPY